MKNRNPIFVAAFPYACILPGYIGLEIMVNRFDSGEEPEGAAAAMLLFFLVLFFAGMAYTIYWLISTARVLRRTTNMQIPNAILTIIPIASYWWMWRYSQAAEVYIKNKYQAALLFVLLAALGSIGMAILQDSYNKLPEATGLNHPKTEAQEK